MEENLSIAILGAGLLGGSVALALRLGIEHVSTDLKAIVAEADIIILATPVGVMEKLAAEIVALREGGEKPFILTDVGSVKRLSMVPPV